MLLANIVYVDNSTPSEVGELFEKKLRPLYERAGATVIAELVSEHSPNTYPALPVRESENVFVWFALFPDQVSADQWRDAGKLSSLTHHRTEVLRLQPTARSRLQG